MPEPEGPATPGAADQPTRLQRAARRSCAGLACHRARARGGRDLVLLEHSARLGAVWRSDVEKLLGGVTRREHGDRLFNYSGRDVSGFVIRYWDQEIHYNGRFEAYREADPNQNIRPYQRMFWRPIRPTTFRLGMTYTEVDTGVTRSGSFTADRSPRPMCRFVFVLEADGPVLSECQRPQVEDFSSS